MSIFFLSFEVLLILQYIYKNVNVYNFLLLISGGATEGHVGEWRIRSTQTGCCQTQASDWNSDIMWSRWRTYKPDNVFQPIGSLWRSEDQFICLKVCCDRPLLQLTDWHFFSMCEYLKGFLSCICNFQNSENTVMNTEHSSWWGTIIKRKEKAE